ncbi:type VII secretion integral membrane protein EccD [Nocardia sp. NEAU-G5]|uniref:Type VII secretion integral membrane protein EccD n=1 Tax=Nocardia albiluteola TaxID=2842303 RepID=A0ABS6B963_9NOCA|nr:type VII secretion integral membrane protein EccD [Nocardia albiluteola]MBU3066832.1 type VII secretion integral membrane protein EccD [Nocardia albiluteola]
MTSTAVAPAPAAPSQPSAEVARARIAVMVATYQVDVALPTKFTIETFIDDLLGVLSDAIDDDTVDFTPAAGQWSLARPGEAPIPRWRSLSDYHVVDGTVMMLSVVESAESFTPIVEDVTDALAMINEREFAEYDADASVVAGVSMVGAAALAIAVMLSWIWTDTGSALWCAVPALLLGATSWLAAMGIRRRPGAARIALGLTIASIPLLFAGGAMLVPPAYGHPGPFAAANLAAGAVVAAVASAAMLRISGHGVTVLLAVTVLGAALAIAVLPATYLDISAKQVAGGVVLAGLVLLTSGPRLAVLAARIRPPDLPDPGTEVAPTTLADIFDAESGREDEFTEEAGDPWVARSDGIEARARLAVLSLRGLIVAITILLSGATICAAAVSPGGIREIVLAVAVAGILGMRARWYPDRVQAVALVAAAATTVIGVAFVEVGAYHTPYARLAVPLVVAAIATLGCVAAVRLPGVRLSPVTRRLTDLAEYALILAVPVLSCWIMGIYTAMRAI